jgi:hypothetical protein
MQDERPDPGLARDALGVTDTSSGLHNAMAAAVVGGTVSVIAGGKFANGAVTAAFSHMFNDWRHSLARRAQRAKSASHGSTEMPDLDPGVYPIVKDSALIAVGEIGDLWVIDAANSRVLRFVTLGAGLGGGLRASREFGAMYVPASDTISGFGWSFDVEGTVGFGGVGTLVGNPASPDLAPFASGGPSVGLSVGAGPFGGHTQFQRVYSFDEAPGHLPLGK